MRAITSTLQCVLVVAFIAVAAPHGAHAGDRWQWSITPYMWASGISETLTLDGKVVGGGDTEFKDLVDKIDNSLQLHFEGIGDRVGLFADIMYVDLSDSQSGEHGLVRFDADIAETVLEGGVIWRPGGRTGTLDILLGARQYSVDEKYRLQLGELGTLEERIDESYLDALVGARWHIPLSDRWVVSLRGDASTGGTDYIWTAQGTLAWRFGKKRNSAVLAGYRYREMKYTKADVLEDRKTVSGPGLGLRIGF